MSNTGIKNLPASIHQRLLNKARERNRPFNELLQYYAMERFLNRLSESDHKREFFLKGAVLLTTWGGEAFRTTTDIDLLGITSNQVEDIVETMKAVGLQSVEPDGLLFDPHSFEGMRIAEDARYEGVRVKFRGNLGTAGSMGVTNRTVPVKLLFNENLSFRLGEGLSDEFPGTKPV